MLYQNIWVSHQEVHVNKILMITSSNKQVTEGNGEFTNLKGGGAKRSGWGEKSWEKKASGSSMYW